MPKVYTSEKERTGAKIQRMIVGQMKAQKVTQKDLGNIWGISSAGAGYKIREGKITLYEFRAANKLLKFDDEDILHILGGGF